MVQQNYKQKYKGEDGTAGQEDMGQENIIRKRRLKWLSHVWHMDKDRRANQTRYCIGFSREEREEEDRRRSGQRPLRAT